MTRRWVYLARSGASFFEVCLSNPSLAILNQLLAGLHSHKSVAKYSKISTFKKNIKSDHHPTSTELMTWVSVDFFTGTQC